MYWTKEQFMKLVRQGYYHNNIRICDMEKKEHTLSNGVCKLLVKYNRKVDNDK